jgi:hypothetical protein
VFEHCFVGDPLYVPPLIIEISAAPFTWFESVVTARSFPADTVALWHSEHSKFVPRYATWFMCATWSFDVIGPRPVVAVAAALPGWHESHCGSAVVFHAIDGPDVNGAVRSTPFEWQYVFEHVPDTPPVNVPGV